jgi:hypothetical protein
MRTNERKELQSLSNNRVSKWSNTIHAQREKKEYERIKKLEDDEVSAFFLYFVCICYSEVIILLNFLDREKKN